MLNMGVRKVSKIILIKIMIFGTNIFCIELKAKMNTAQQVVRLETL